MKAPIGARGKLAPRTKNVDQLRFGLKALKQLWAFHAAQGSRGKSAQRHLRRMKRLESRISMRESWINIAEAEE